MVALEERVRRDLLVADEALVAFFDARVPDRRHHRPPVRPVVEGRARARSPTCSPTRRPISSSPMPASIDLAGFPDRWPLGRRPPAAHLRARPRRRTSTAWWSTCPCTLLDAVGGARPRLAGAGAPARARHGAPAHPAEGRSAAITRRPRTWPRSCWPAVGPGRRPAARRARARPSAVARACPVAAHHLDLAAVPAHLRVTYRAVDDGGRPLAWSKDLPALRRRLAERVREALAAARPGRRGAAGPPRGRSARSRAR